MANIKGNQDGLIHLFAVSILLILVIGVGGAWVYNEQTKTPIKLAKNEGKVDVGTYKELREKEVAEIESATVTPDTATTKATESTQPALSTSKKVAPAPTSTTATHTAPQTPLGKITISEDGCYVTAEGEPGMTLEVGAVKVNKGGSMTYTMPNKGPITKATGGFKDMMAYGSLYSTDGTKIVFKSATITASECPPAG